MADAVCVDGRVKPVHDGLGMRVECAALRIARSSAGRRRHLRQRHGRIMIKRRHADHVVWREDAAGAGTAGEIGNLSLGNGEGYRK